MGAGKKPSELESIRRDLRELTEDLFLELPLDRPSDKLWDIHARARDLADRVARVTQEQA